MLEDIDQASGDCFPLIAQLVERNILSIAGHGRPITPHPTFRLILSQRVTNGHGTKSGNMVSSLYTKCHFVSLPAHTTASLERIIAAHYPKLPKSIQKIPVNLLTSLQTAQKIPTRKLGVRECITFAARVNRHQTDLSGSQRVAFAVLDAIDIFGSHLSTRSDRHTFISRICQVHSANRDTIRAMALDQGDLAAANDPTKFFLDFYRPEIIPVDDLFTAGRAKMMPVGELDHKFVKRSDMVATLIHARVMEQIVVAINQVNPTF